jgi:predicted DNA-binding transcriptional regulator AlpA
MRAADAERELIAGSTSWADVAERGQAARPAAILYDIRQVAALLNKSIATINRFRRLGRFPEPDCRVGKTPTWRRRTIERWIDAGGTGPKG